MGIKWGEFKDGIRRLAARFGAAARREIRSEPTERNEEGAIVIDFPLRYRTIRHGRFVHFEPVDGNPLDLPAEPQRRSEPSKPLLPAPNVDEGIWAAYINEDGVFVDLADLPARPPVMPRRNFTVVRGGLSDGPAGP